jgi:hypothetical protein
MRYPGGGRALRLPMSAFAGFRFPPEAVVLAVRWYLHFGLSYRDVEELLAERGIDVDHVTIYRWVQRFTPLLVDARPCRYAVGDRWRVDETYVKVGGQWRYIYRAIDQHGQVIDVFVSARRDTAAARGSSPRCCAITAHRRRSSPIAHGRCAPPSKISSRPPFMTRPSVRTTGSRPITVGSRPGYDRCAV